MKNAVASPLGLFLAFAIINMASVCGSDCTRYVTEVIQACGSDCTRFVTEIELCRANRQPGSTVTEHLSGECP